MQFEFGDAKKNDKNHKKTLVESKHKVKFVRELVEIPTRTCTLVPASIFLSTRIIGYYSRIM